MSVYSCEVVSCKSTGNHPNRSFHRFPIDPARRNEWVKILDLKSTKLKVNAVVCSRHFHLKDFYPSSKRLLPGAVPSIRLSKCPSKNIKVKNITSKIKENVPMKQSNVISPKEIRKTAPKIVTSKFKNSFKSNKFPKVKLSSKSNLSSCSSKSKEHFKAVLKPNQCSSQTFKKNTRPCHDIQDMKIDVKEAVGKNNSKQNKSTLKPASKINQRSSLNVKKKVLDKTEHARLCKSNNENSQSKRKLDPMKTKKAKSKSTNNSNPKVNQISDTAFLSMTPESYENIIETCIKEEIFDDDIDYINNFPDSFSSEKIITSESTCVSNQTSKQISQTTSIINTEVENNVEDNALTSKTKRPVRKRKRLLSESEFETNELSCSKSKVHKTNTYSGVSNNQLGKGQSSIYSADNKDLSSIEKTILEMQSKIQILEKKAIMDEEQIETFKKALISQRNNELQRFMDEKGNQLLLNMDLIYLHYDPQRICRLCLLLVDKKEQLTPLFWPLEQQTLVSLVEQATDVKLELEEGMPSGVCEYCLEEIRRISWLKHRTQRCDALIRKFVCMKKSSTPNSLEVTQVTSDVKSMPGEEAIRDEVEQTDVFKIEDVFSLENSPVAFENISLKQEPEADDECKEKNDLDTTCSVAVKRPRKCRSCSITFKTQWTLMNHVNYCRKRFQCSECNKTFWNAKLFRKHKQRMSSCFCEEHLRYCSACNVSFRRKWQLVFHVLLHNSVVCVLCKDTLHSKEHLRQHFIEYHSNYSGQSPSVYRNLAQITSSYYYY